MLAPKRVRRRKVQKGRMKGLAYRGSDISFGDYGLQATTCGYVTSRQIEAARIAMTRHVKRGGTYPFRKRRTDNLCATRFEWSSKRPHRAPRRA